MKTTHHQIEDGQYSLQAAVTQCGADIAVQVCGGSLPHIGAVALGVPRPSLRGGGKSSASVSVLCVTGHKDDEFARMAAKTLASRLGRLATVTVGIHIDEAKESDIRRLYDNFLRLVDEVAAGLALEKQ